MRQLADTPIFSSLSLASGVAAVDLIDARSTRCSGEARTLLHVATAQTGPQGTSAEYSTDLSVEYKLTVILSIKGTCWAVRPFYFTGGTVRGAPAPLPRRRKTLA